MRALAPALFMLTSVCACGKAPAPPTVATTTTATPATATAPATTTTTTTTTATAAADAAASAPAADAASESADTRASADAKEAVRKLDPLAGFFAHRACAAGERDACIEAAHIDADTAERLATTIYLGESLPGLDALASNMKACELGDWRSCGWVADTKRDGICREGLFDSTADEADPALTAQYDTKAHELAAKACDGGRDAAACRFIALRMLEGCGATREVAAGMERFVKAIAGASERCAAGELGRCEEVSHACRIAEELAAPASAADDDGKARPLRVRSATASSVLPPWKGYRFGADNLIDGDITTSWQPLDKKRGGVGQWFYLRLDADVLVSGIDVANGLQKTDALGDLFALNNRVVHAAIELSDGTSIQVKLDPDKRGFTEVRFGARRTSSIHVSIESIHRGEKWNDLAVSEVRVIGGAAMDEAHIELPAACGLARDKTEERCRAGDRAGCSAFVSASFHDEGAVAIARKLAAEVLGKRCDEAKGDEPAALALCEEAGRYALLAGGMDERARALYQRACRGGSAWACGTLGCHGREEALDGSFWEERLGAPEPALCEAACEGGDVASCLVLSGVGDFDAKGIDATNPWVAKVITRAQAQCADAASCLSEGKRVEESREPREPLGLVEYLTAHSLYDKACRGGSADGCDAVTDLVDLWGGDAEQLEQYRELGCKHGSVSACGALAQSGDKAAAAALAQALAKLVASCDSGDLEHCESLAARTDLGAEDDTRVKAKLRELVTKACEAGDPHRCRQRAEIAGQDDERAAFLGKAVELAGKTCIDKGECLELCNAALDRVGGGSFVGSDVIDVEALAPVVPLVPELSAEMIQWMCSRLALEDECACGCC